MQVYPISRRQEEIDSANQTLRNLYNTSSRVANFQAPSNSKRLTISKTSRNIFAKAPSPIDIRLSPSRRDSHHKLSYVSTVSKSSNLKRNYYKQLKGIVRKLMNVQNFIKELKSYADQLRTEHMEFRYRHRNMFPIYPDDISYNIWIIFMKVLHFIAAILIPLQVSYQFDGFIQTLTDLINISFALDVLFNFFSCHIDQNLELLTKINENTSYYLHHWFLLDVISILPYEYFPDAWVFSPLKLIRVFKFFVYQQRQEYRMSKDIIKKKEEVIQENLMYKSHFWVILRVQKLIIIFFDMILLTHLFACLWYWSAKWDSFNSETWVSRYDTNQQSQYTIYVNTFYWALQTVTVIGYGDFEARTSMEFMLQTVWMLVGVGFYSFTIGNITYILTQSNPNQDFDEMELLLENLDHSAQLLPEVYIELRNFVEYNINYNPFWSFQSKIILSDLPPQLGLFVLTAVYKDLFFKIPFFINDFNFALQVLPYCTIVNYDQYETIYHIGQSANDFYFLINGDVSLTDSAGDTILRVMEGTAFGEIESIEQTLRRWHAHAVRKSIVLICPGKNFFERLTHNSPQYFELEQMYKRRLLLIQEYQKSKRIQFLKVKRSTAIINEEQLITMKGKSKNYPGIRRGSFNRTEFKTKIDCRSYYSLQQDLMLRVVGQRNDRRKFLIQKFKNVINRIKQLVKTAKRRGALTEGPDFKIIRNLIQNRLSVNTGPFFTTQLMSQPAVGKRMLENFSQVCANEEIVQAIILKTKQESLAKLQRYKLKIIIDRMKQGQLQKKNEIKRDQQIFFSHLHQTIYNEAQQERVTERERQRYRQNTINNFSITQQKVRELNRVFRYISKQQTAYSIAKFAIVQKEREIDDIIDQCQEFLRTQCI